MSEKNTINMQEIWKDIEGYEGYKVSNLGHVKSKKCVLKQFVSKGYLTVRLNNKTKRVHRLVAITFLSNEYNKKEVDHIDGNPLNNNVENLRWATRSENESNPITRKRLSNSLSGRKCPWVRPPESRFGTNHYRSIPISQFTLDDVFVSDYANAYEASRITGINKQSIYCCLKGKFKRAGNYKWKYKK